MKKNVLFAAAGIAVGTAMNAVQAQEPGYFGGIAGGGDDSQFLNQPFMFAIDKDGDGEISLDEIENSVESLSALDKNRNGDLDYDELSGGIEKGPFVGWLRMLTAIRVIDRSGDSEIWVIDHSTTTEEASSSSGGRRLFEVTPDNEVVMDFVLEHLLPEELGHVGGRIWRAFKLPADYPGLAGRL